jgi:transposase-like protein
MRIEKRYRRYTPEAPLKTYQLVKQKGVRVQKAARMFGVPPQTLRDRVLGHIHAKTFLYGGDTLFTHEEKKSLVEHVETLAELGYGYSNVRLQQLAGELAHDLGKKKENKAMSNKWLTGFLKCWNDRLTSLNPRKLESTRAKSVTPGVLDKYFTKLKEVLLKHD